MTVLEAALRTDWRQLASLVELLMRVAFPQPRRVRTRDAIDKQQAEDIGEHRTVDCA